MSTQLATTAKPSALAVMASRFSVDPTKLLETLKNTAFKNANDSQMMALVIVSNEYGLNPFTKQIYAFPDKGGGIIPVVSVDGWIKLMNDQPRFDGIEFEMVETPEGKPVSCTATIYVKERARAVKVTEYYVECHRNTDPWNKSPRRMLRHKALIQCVRVAFGLSGVHDEDEAKDISDMKVATVREVQAPPIPAKRLGPVAPVPVPAEVKAAPAEPEPNPEPEQTQEPEQQEQQSDQQQDATTPKFTPAPSELPGDTAAVLSIAKDMLAERDIEPDDALRCLKARKKCGTACKTLGESARSGLVWLVENIDSEVLPWINANHE